MADWTTISALATAGGTLTLAGATFASTRASSRSARVAERALLAGLRPLLVPSRLDDTPQKVRFADGRVVVAPGGGGATEVADDAIYLVMSLRNVGTGLAVLHGWRLYPGRRTGDEGPGSLDEFQRLSRDIFVAAADVGFWQGAFRDPAADAFATTRIAIESGESLTIDLLYGDHEGGQRVVTRFLLWPREDGRWMSAAGRHWNIDREDPR